MTTRCKMKCNATGEVAAYYGSQEIHHTATFAVVHGPSSAENDSFFASTPSGNITLQTLKQPFKVGKDYYIDFTEVEKAEE